MYCNDLKNARILLAGLGTAILLALTTAAGAAGLRPRPQVIKPQHVRLESYHRDDVIRVKFHDDAPVRSRDGALTDLGTGALDDAADVLAALDGAAWRPLIDADEQDLEDLRQTAQQNLNKAVADFRVWFHVFLPSGADAAAAIDALNTLDAVELAEPVQVAAPPPTPPAFGHDQANLNAGPVGLGALAAWEHLGTRGINVNIIDIEFGWEIWHQDLPTVNLIQFGDPPATQAEEDHGTATLGVLGALDNGWGTTGMAPDAVLGFAHVRVGGVVNIPQAIVNSALNSSPGDIILIELQIAGPAACGSPCGAPLGLPPCDCSAGTAWVPVEWSLAEYNAIVSAVGAGRIVIEPAGNGAQNLDAPIYQTGHNPFQNDSGAIMVGAGMPPMIHGGLDVDRSRICCSNYGSRVDVQGHGWAVRSTGYGDLNAEASGQLDYTAQYAGTSSASAMVAGAAALVQSAYKWANNSAILPPLALRQALVNSGSPQQSAIFNSFPASQNIGPRPDAAFAILLTVGGCMPLYGTAVGNPGLDQSAWALESFNDGNGSQLYAGGYFANAGGVSATDVAAWDGTSWSAVGSGPNIGPVQDFEVYYDGRTVALYAAGGFAGPSGGIARWDGSSWTTIGTTNGNVIALGQFNGDLYAGGAFNDVNGTAASYIARWNGTSWSAVGSGTNQVVWALYPFDDGSGLKLYVGGMFTAAGGSPAANVARWDGTSWSSIAGFNGPVSSFTAFDDGNGAALFAGGYFSVPQQYVARWDGSQWQPLGTIADNGTFNFVEDLTVFDDGTGDALYVAGSFEDVTNTWSRGVAKWDGTRFWALGDGVNGAAYALGVYDDGNGEALFAAGGFGAAWDLPTTNIVQWSSCATPCPGDIDGSGTVDVSDFLLLLGAWGPNPGHPADLDGDGLVGVTDFLLLLAGWGTCP
jgi:hypothetical protein